MIKSAAVAAAFTVLAVLVSGGAGAQELAAPLDTASDLLGPSKREGDLRSATSRAYYAVYQTLRLAVMAQCSLALLQSSGLGDKKMLSERHEEQSSTTPSASGIAL